MPTVDADQWDDAVAQLDERRRRLHGIVAGDAWTWEPPGPT